MGFLEVASATLSQGYFIGKPALTESNLPDQTGRVHIVTGGYAGCGTELSRILYQRNATVYVAGRSKDKADKTIASIKQKVPSSAGKLEFLHLDLADVTTIKKSADEFLAKEDRLDVLTNNAGVMVPPKGSTDAHGREQQLGTNVLGPWLFTNYLVPILQKTAASSPQGSVRVTWASSSASYFAPKGGVAFGEDGSPRCFGNPGQDYAQSKAANNLLAAEFASRHGKDGIVSVSWNPGNLKTELSRHTGSIVQFILDYFVTYPAVYGAYTELYAGWSTDIGSSQNGAFVVPWGKIAPARSDVIAGGKSTSEGGTGEATKLWAWCEKECKAHL